MNGLCQGALSVLEKVYDEDSALYPFTNWLVGREYRSIYDHRMTIRSTINCLLGLQQASRQEPDDALLGSVDRQTRRFLALHGERVLVPGDLGLLLVLLAGGDADQAGATVERITAIAERPTALRKLTVQDVSWLLWGCVSAAEAGFAGTEQLAHRLFDVMARHFCPRRAALPCHRVTKARFGVVSFGACTYFLRAVHDYASWCDSTAARQLFDRALEAILAAQGPNGEWPWLLRNTDGRPLDVYPVFSVHQLSMCLLFLCPGSTGCSPHVAPAVTSSMEWVKGNNQLGIKMYQQDPFFVYRSLERRARLPRAERYARALSVSASGRRAALVENRRLFVNRESRSYELGWALYTHSGNPGLWDPT
ncbi:MAG TPA: hypothetical protein VHT30_05445 [Acidimicrobiales bacterium]|nr:hypothetical protein [Acidimicrobiales bacterium]